MKRAALILSIFGVAIICSDARSEALQPEIPSVPSVDATSVSEYEEGRKSLHGRGVEKNPEKALEHFRKAAELGHIEAPGAIGYFYSVGLVVEKDEAKAAECFQKGSDKGSALAKFNLGRFHLDGKGGLSGTDTGLALMEEAAAGGIPEAHAALAEIYFLGLYCSDHKPDYAKAAPHVKAAAASGEPAVINMLGVMKQKGLGVEKDEKEAEACFREAAMKGDFKAQSNLGHLLDPESKKLSRRIEATAWIILAASQGEPLASRKVLEIEQTMSQKEFNKARDKADELQAKISEAGTK